MSKRLATGVLVCALLILMVAGAGGYLERKTTLPEKKARATSVNASDRSRNGIYYRNRVVVLLYHDFSYRERGTAISPSRLASHFQMLWEKGFHVIPLDQAVEFARGRGQVPVNAVAITFDDGYASNYRVAYPLLRKYHWPATIFVTVSNVGRTESVHARTKWLTWAEMREMSQNNIQFGGHTYNGHFITADATGNRRAWLIAHLPGESQKDYEQRILEDFRRCNTILMTELGYRPQHFAPPYGVDDKQSVQLALKSGYRFVWTTRRVAVTRGSDLTALGRVSVGIKGTTASDLLKTILRVAFR